MKTITVSKEDLKSALVKNRTAHVKDFNLATENYWLRAEAEVERLLRRVKGKRVDNNELFINLQKPESHETDYDTALEMLEWHMSDTIEVSQTEFKQFIQDEWQWKRNFAATTQFYNG